jgi:F-type H+-transporting ATPase subunit delta
LIRIIAKRYARALVELAYEKDLVDRTRADLAAFTGVVDGQAMLQKLLSSPAFTPEAKKAVIAELSSRLGLQQTSARFLASLADTGRIRYVREMREAFEELLAERQNRAVARVTTAAPLVPGEVAEIKKKLEAVTGKQVEVDAQVDPAVIGGARAAIGSVVYDGTIRNQLGKMRERLVK